MTQNIITLYDISSTIPGGAYASHTWAVRYSLNYKRLHFKTEWVEFPDIEALCKRIGVEPTIKKSDGIFARDFYTLPVIHDASTGEVVADSLEIVRYLDATYPETPKLIPQGTLGFHRALIVAHHTTLIPLYQFTIPAMLSKLKPDAQAYFRQTREEFYKKPLEDVVPVGKERDVQWAKLKKALDTVEGWCSSNGGTNELLMMGESICFADIVVVSSFKLMIKIWGDDSAEWKDVKDWNGGRWKKMLDFFEKFEGGL